jgi:hypothetical protein
MRNRTAIVILLVAAGLLAFIFLFERHQPTTSEVASRKGRAFVDFRRDDVTALTVRGSGGGTVSLERRAGDPADPAAERWVVTGGERELTADAGAVRQVLSAIDFLLEDRAVKEPGAAADPGFGLDPPRVELSFTARGRVTSFRVGADAPGDKVYLAVEGRPEVLAVEAEFLGEVDKGLDDLRDKRLLERPLSGAVGLTLAGGEEGAVELTRADDRSPWRVGITGASVLAAADRAGNLLRELGRLEAARFVADGVGPEGLAGHGLDPAARTVIVSLPGGERAELRLGGDCEGDGGLIRATVAGSGTVACVDRRILGELSGGAERFRELRPAPVREDDVVRVELARGKDELTLEREEEGGAWKVTGIEGAPELDQEAVSGLLGRLAAIRAAELLAGQEVVAGLGEPVARVSVHSGGEQPAVALSFHPWSGQDLVAVRRGAEAALLIVEAGLLEAVRPDLLAFRARAVENAHAEDATRLVVEGPVAYSIEKKEGTWTVVAPAELAADGFAARALAKRAARVEVERFEAPAAAPEHGLARPFARLVAIFADEKPAADGKESSDRTGEKRVAIEIGAETPAGDGSRFARVAGGDGAVFVLSRSWIDELGRPPLARDLLQVEAAAVRRVTVTQGDGKAEAAREGDVWSGAAPGFDKAAFGRALADLAAVRTVRAAAAGREAAVTAVGEPRATVELAMDGEKSGAGPVRLLFGAPDGDPADPGVLVRREGVDAAFVVPARILDDLLRALGLAAPAAPITPPVQAE